MIEIALNALVLILGLMALLFASLTAGAADRRSPTPEEYVEHTGGEVEYILQCPSAAPSPDQCVIPSGPR